MTTTAQAPFRAKLKFLADLAAPLVYVASRGGGDQTEHLGNFCDVEVEVRDARAELPSPTLDQEGFMLCRHPSAVRDFYDDASLQGIYHRELVDLLKEKTGARRVEVFDDTRRTSSVELQQQRGIREPANIVHNDYTADSGPRRLKDFLSHTPEETDPPRSERFAIINAWRPIAGTVIDHPLVLCDATSVREEDLVPIERRAAERTGELQVLLYDAAQRWYFYPEMNRDEVLLFKTFDSAIDGRARFTPHSSCKNPRAPADTPPRESLETRCLVFF